MLLFFLGAYLGGLLVCTMWRICDLTYAEFSFEDVPMILMWPLTMGWMLYNMIKYS